MEMEQNENQPVKSRRELIAERMQAMYPDRDYVNGNGENGESGEDVLQQAVLDALQGYSDSENEYKAKNELMNNLFFGDPLAAEFVTRWSEDGDPRAALVETFGDDLESLGTEEGRSQFKNQLQNWRERKAENDRLNQEAQQNWDKTLEAAEQYRQEHNLTVKQMAEIVIRLVSITANGLVNKYGPEEFDMITRIQNYDNDINEARRAGEVAGRNAHIEENKRRRQSASALPPSLGGQGMRVPENKPEPEEKPFWDGIE